MKKKIFLVDLTHTGQSVASNVFPLAIGLIANYILQESPNEYDIELFKYPNDLAKALSSVTPDVVGFSNYSWNCDISYKFTEKIKQHSPNTVVIWGGPNYGLTNEEKRDFWSMYPLIDFYLVKEGEKATLELFKLLQGTNFNIAQLKASNVDIPNAHFLNEHKKIITGELLPRIKNLEDIGSPYTSGLMDKFFDDVLIPMVHTTRGCPFSCTFCTEGNSYYNKVAQRKNFKDEIEYIARRRRNVQDLLITDANFGMFSQDREKADVIAEIQDKYKWPNKILVSTGKNKKDNVIEVAKKLGGSLSIAASLQTTNLEILKSIKRINISSDALNIIVEECKQDNTPTYTEIILGLPGDSLIIHTQSLRDVINSGLGIIRMYQLILLPQTEIATPQARAEHGMKTVFRVNPRSFGNYFCYGEAFPSVEYEEICIANNTLPSVDYLRCRQLNLSVEIIHNTSLFFELHDFCNRLGINWFDFILKIHEQILISVGDLKNIYEEFKVGCFSNTFESKEALLEYYSYNMDLLVGDVGGTNEMAKGKARAVFEALPELHDIVYSVLDELLKINDLSDDTNQLYLTQLKKISLLRKCNLTDRKLNVIEHFNFNFDEIGKTHYQCDPFDYYLEEGIELSIGYSQKENQYIDSYYKQYGHNLEGLGRILMRISMPKLFRSVLTTSSEGQ